MRRREFITLLGGAAASWPLVARAQQSSLPTIGLLFSGTQEAFANDSVALDHGLKEVGYINGQNVTIQYRWASGEYDKLPALARDLVDRKVDVIVTGGASRLHWRLKQLPQ